MARAADTELWGTGEEKGNLHESRLTSYNSMQHEVQFLRSMGIWKRTCVYNACRCRKSTGCGEEERVSYHDAHRRRACDTPGYCEILETAHKKGYWTVVTTNGLYLDEEIIKAYKRCRTLAEGDSITAEKLLDIFGTDQESAEKVAELLEELTEQAYISNGAEDRVKELITHLIVGTASMGFGGNAGGYSSTLLVCDSNIVTEQLEIMSGQISLPMEVLSEEDAAEIAAADLTGILFALEQALFTSSGRQCLSMVLASLGISFVACVSTAYTGSFLPCLLADECFLVFYFGRFRYY